MRWSLPGGYTAYAVAGHPSGDVAAVTPAGLVRLRYEGGVDTVAELDWLRGRGIAFDGDAIEVVLAPAGSSGDGVQIVRFEPDGRRTEQMRSAVPASPGAESLLLYGERVAAGWRLVWARAVAAERDDPEGHMEVVIVLQDPAENFKEVGTVRVPAEHYRARHWFDASPGGHTMKMSDALLRFRLDGEQVVTVPALVDSEPARLPGPDFLIRPGAGVEIIHKHVLPRETGRPIALWLHDRWIVLHTDEGYALSAAGELPGPAAVRGGLAGGIRLTTDSVLPASDGGYWLLGNGGYFARLDAEFRRVDPMSTFDRVRRLFGNFERQISARRLGDTPRPRYRRLEATSLPVVLLGLPLALMGAWLVGGRRGAPGQKARVMAVGSAIYLSAALLFAKGFVAIVASL